MLKNFTQEDKNFLKGLKTKHFHFIIMKCMSIKRKLKEKQKKKKEEEKKRRRRKKQKKEEEEKQDEKTKTDLNDLINGLLMKKQT